MSTSEERPKLILSQGPVGEPCLGSPVFVLTFQVSDMISGRE